MRNHPRSTPPTARAQRESFRWLAVHVFFSQSLPLCVYDRSFGNRHRRTPRRKNGHSGSDWLSKPRTAELQKITAARSAADKVIRNQQPDKTKKATRDCSSRPSAAADNVRYRLWRWSNRRWNHRHWNNRRWNKSECRIWSDSCKE